MSTVISRTTYAYDGAHNRTQKVKDGVTTNYGYNSLNQMTGFTEGSRQVSFGYDANGNRVSRTENDQTDEYSYDYENRLVEVQKGSVAHAYTYDYRTRRVERVEGNTTTKIVFSGGTSAQEYEGDNRTVEYIRGSDYGGGIGGILYTLRNSQPSYTHYNNRGDVVAKTGPEQEVTYQASYEAFGTRTKEVGQTQDRQKANTKEEDPTGLLNEGFRYRDLETGSFITRDPLGFNTGPNFYTFVHQNPWTKFDPEGLADDKKWEQIERRYKHDIHIYNTNSSRNRTLKDEVSDHGKELQARIGLPVGATAQFYENYIRALQHTEKGYSEAAFSFTANTTKTFPPGTTDAFRASAHELQTHVNMTTPAQPHPDEVYNKALSGQLDKIKLSGRVPSKQDMKTAEKWAGYARMNYLLSEGKKDRSILLSAEGAGLRGFAHTHIRTDDGRPHASSDKGDISKLQLIEKHSSNSQAYGFVAVPSANGTARVYRFFVKNPVATDTGIVIHYR